MRLALIAALLSLSLLLVAAATPAAPTDAAQGAADAAPFDDAASNIAFKDGVQASPTPSASFVRELTDATFEHDTQASTGGTTGDWFVMFAAPWCGHCTQMKPTWAELSAKVREDQIPVSIAHLDATVNTRTAKRFDVRGFPTLKLLSQGKVYDYSGPRTLSALHSYLDNREWLTRGDGRPMPTEVSAWQSVVAAAREAANDMTILVSRKPGGAAVLVIVGLLIGILVSMLIFILFLEKQPIVYQIGDGKHAPPGAVLDSPAAGASAASASAAAPPTNAAAKKAH